MRQYIRHGKLTSKGDISNLLVPPSAANGTVVPWEPNLLQVGNFVIVAKLPQTGEESIAGLVKGE